MCMDLLQQRDQMAEEVAVIPLLNTLPTATIPETLVGVRDRTVSRCKKMRKKKRIKGKKREGALGEFSMKVYDSSDEDSR